MLINQLPFSTQIFYISFKLEISFFKLKQFNISKFQDLLKLREIVIK